MAHGAVQDCKEQDGQRCEHHIEGSGGDVVHHGLTGEAAVKLVVEQDEAERNVLVEGVLDETRQPVCAQRPVHQEQPRQKPVPMRHASVSGVALSICQLQPKSSMPLCRGLCFVQNGTCKSRCTIISTGLSDQRSSIHARTDAQDLLSRAAHETSFQSFV